MIYKFLAIHSFIKWVNISIILFISSTNLAFGLQQTGNDRTPTWTTFKVRSLGNEERGAFFGLGAFCQFPEQFAPKRPNPRWENERPFRKHFVERFNPAFSGCFLKPFVSIPDLSYDFKIPAEFHFEFEKSLPIGFQPHASGMRQAIIRTNLAENRGKVISLPEMQGTPDQTVVLSFYIFGKKLTEIEFLIDSSYILNFHQYRREADDQIPYVIRQWEPK